MRRFVAFVALAGAISTVACDGFGQAMTAHTDVLARAAGHELTVDQATNLLAPATQIPAQNDVVDAVANLWIDYVLLATAAAQDSTLSNIDLDAIIEPYFNQQLVFRLRDEVIEVDTMVTDEELRQLFDQSPVGAEVRARHILFRLPPDASPQDRQAVQQRAEAVRQQAVGGADFAQLAAEHTEEPGGAERGGDLGYFGPNQMVQPFEEAAFALQAGEVSGLVETPFGIHIIKVEDRRSAPYEDVRDQFREMVIGERVGGAEEAYLTQLTDTRQIQVESGATAIARELASKPGSTLSRRAGQRVLVRYQGGSLTAAEYLALMQQRPAAQRGQIAAASDDQLEDWLRLLARDEILIEEARNRGLAAPQSEQDSARLELREQLVDAARQSGLLPITAQAGETQAQAVQRQVSEFISAIITGQANVIPLGAIGFTLRQQYGAELFERAIPTVVSRVEQRRPAGEQQQPFPQMPPEQMPTEQPLPPAQQPSSPPQP
ncbi:MAG TPA: peptidylprolyl isomerase [Longimicrobiales bacterium]|nr:peptidylprolyl isomerase [Longimicrobiales bacterium]